MKIFSKYLQVVTEEGISVYDLMQEIRKLIVKSGIKNGFLTIVSQHTTTAITVNENEERLVQDVKAFLGRLIPPDDRYLHNDIELRDCPPDQPENAHSHIAAMLLGSSEVINLSEGELQVGQYQSVMLVDLDGPRDRKVSIQIIGD